VSSNTRGMRPSRNQVWDVVSDASQNPLRAAGATQMRRVGVELHHSVGVWSLVLEEDTEVTVKVPDRSAKCSLPRARTRAWTARRTSKGPGRLVLALVHHLMIRWCHVEAAHRIANVTEGRR
jgi:hypothetical protein